MLPCKSEKLYEPFLSYRIPHECPSKRQKTSKDFQKEPWRSSTEEFADDCYFSAFIPEPFFIEKSASANANIDARTFNFENNWWPIRIFLFLFLFMGWKLVRNHNTRTFKCRLKYRRRRAWNKSFSTCHLSSASIKEKKVLKQKVSQGKGLSC